MCKHVSGFGGQRNQPWGGAGQQPATAQGRGVKARRRTRRPLPVPHGILLRLLCKVHFRNLRGAKFTTSVRGSPSKRKREQGVKVVTRTVPCRFPGGRRETQCRAACAPIRARATALRAVQPGAATRASCSGRGCYGLEGAPMLGRFGRRCVEARAPRALTLDTRLPAPRPALAS